MNINFSRASFDDLSDDQQKQLGEYIARLLGLRRNERDRYDTAIGDKTAKGLAATLHRVLTSNDTLPEI